MASNQRVAVENLGLGLYIVELDCQWLETSFPFQGFLIQSDAELESLSAECRVVTIDRSHSDPQALHRLDALVPPEPDDGAGPRLPPMAERELHQDALNAFGGDAYPSDKRFRELVDVAQRTRIHSVQAVDRAFEQLRLGTLVSSEEVREAVHELVGVVSANASAALWLTNLKRRDDYTSTHSINVCVFALAFGRHLGLARKDLELLGLGALLHDIGKIHTPDEILRKPGGLTDGEFDVIKQHPVDGYDMLCGNKRIPRICLLIVRHHHERLSANGYPDGLAGQDIPLPVMITALADAYDAMTSTRPYRGAMTPDEALGILFDNAARDFGTKLTEEFIRCLGIYPVGSLVKLDNGAIALVISSDRQNRLEPFVRLLKTPEGEPYAERPIVNLAALAELTRSAGWRVNGPVRPSDVGLEPAEVVADDTERATLET